MKIKLWTVIIISTAALALNAQTNDLTALLQQGLFEEQANRNLDSAIAVYQNLALQFDKDRQLAATAVFRLGECYRAQGRTNEAAAQYQRILRDFSDQQTLATLSRQDLTAMGVNGAATPPAEQALAASFDLQLWNKLRDMPEAELEKTLPTVVSDTALDGLLKQRYEAQAKLVQLRTDYSESNAVCVQQKALLTELDRQITDRIGGIMQGLKIRAEVAQASGSTSSPENSGKPASAGENDEDKEIARIQQMIQDSPDLINAPDFVTGTPLVKAATAGQLKVAAFLIEHGADINKSVSDVRQNGELLAAGQVTPLVAAVLSGNKVMTKFLIDHGANVNFRANNGDTPLHIAVRKGYASVAEVLLAAHADINAQNDHGITPLISAVESGQIKVIQMELDSGANVNLKDREGRTVLNYAIKTAPEIVQALLNAKADPNTQDSDGRTPLSYATEKDPQIVGLLLAAKAAPNLGTLNTPLLCAIHTDNAATAESLLKAGANPNAAGRTTYKVTINGSTYVGDTPPITPLYFAVSINRLPMVQLLLKYKADPNNSQTGEVPLFAALDKPDTAKTLLEAGANPEVTHASRDSIDVHLTLLQEAADQNQAETVALLLQHGANPNASDGGNSALHYAAFNLSDEEVFTSLFIHKANPNVRNRDGETPLDILKQAGDSGSWGRFNSRDVIQARVDKLIPLLHQYGALDKPPDWDSITMSRPSGNISFPIFQRGTNDWNRFSLLEAIFNSYASSIMYPVQRNGMTTLVPLAGMLPFPDLRHVIISRPSHNSTNESQQVINLLNETNDIDVTKDIPLEFGDVVEIRERDHALGESNGGLTDNQTSALAEYLKGAVQLVAHGQKVNISIRRYGDRATLKAVLSSPEGQILLRVSSDLSRVKVTRAHPKEGEKREWIVDFNQTRARNGNQFAPLAFSTRSEVAPPDALWLRDGDVISVPEKF